MADCNCNETKFCGLPLGRVLTAEELQVYINNLLCKVDQKLHDIELICSNPSDEEKTGIIASISTIRCEIMNLQTELQRQAVLVRCASEKNNEISLDIIKIREKVKVLYDEIGRLDGVDAGLTTSIAEIQKTLQDNILNIDGLRSRADALEEGLEEVKSGLREYEDAVDTTLNGLQHRIETNEINIATLDTQLKSLNGVVLEHEAEITELAEKSSAVEQDVAEALENSKTAYSASASAENIASKALDATADIQEEVDQLFDDADVDRKKIQSNSERIVVLEELPDRVTSAEEDIFANVSQISSIKARVTALEALPDELDAVKLKVNSNQTRVTSLEERMPELDILNSKVAKIVGDMDVTVAEVNAMQALVQQIKDDNTINRGTMDAIQEQYGNINAMYAGVVTELAELRKLVGNITEPEIPEVDLTEIEESIASLSSSLELYKTQFDAQIRSVNGLFDTLADRVDSIVAPNASDALKKANTAISTSADAVEKANSALESANSVSSEVATIKQSIITLGQTVNNQLTAMQTSIENTDGTIARLCSNYYLEGTGINSILSKTYFSETFQDNDMRRYQYRLDFYYTIESIGTSNTIDSEDYCRYAEVKGAFLLSGIGYVISLDDKLLTVGYVTISSHNCPVVQLTDEGATAVKNYGRGEDNIHVIIEVTMMSEEA